MKELVKFYKDDDGNIHVHIEKMGTDEIQKVIGMMDAAKRQILKELDKVSVKGFKK